MSTDRYGYYATLGLVPTATAAEIKAAFRRLSKEFHPDHNVSPEATSIFHRITEAYACVGNSEKRAAYDALCLDAEEQSATKLEPIICASCNKVTAQPRYLVFRHVVSFITVTRATPIQGIFCSSCANKKALKATTISAIAGWWGFPFGPIWTVKEIIANAFGGHRPSGAEQKLLWVNALAFYGGGNFKLAYGLARRVQSLPGEELATHASELIADLSQRGLVKDNAPLKNPWALRAHFVAAQLSMGAALPIALFILIAASSKTPIPNTQVATAGPPVATAAAASTPPQGQLDGSTPPAALAATCATPPQSGTLLGGTEPDASPGSKLTIKNGSEGPVIVKVRHDPDGTLAFSFYVATGDSTTIPNIEDGTYRIQYALGDYLKPDCRTLGGLHTVAALPDADTLSTRTEDDRIVTSDLSYTLYPVPNGNVQPQQISADDFNAK